VPWQRGQTSVLKRFKPTILTRAFAIHGRIVPRYESDTNLRYRLPVDFLTGPRYALQMPAPRSRLSVEIDGVALPDDAAREVWRRFSEFCDNGGLPAGFAKLEEVASVTPTVKQGVPTLLVESHPSATVTPP
jgi:hypothetical protein